MDEIMIVAILDRSTGNESVGEMWKETKVFPVSTELFSVMKWANSINNNSNDVSSFKGNLTLTIAQ